MALDLPPHLRLSDTADGTMLNLVGDMYIGKSLEKYGECCRIESDMFDRLVFEGAYVVEAGANIGIHTIPIAKKVGPTGCVFACEPQRIIFQILCTNITLNGLRNVDAKQIGLGETYTSMTIPALDYTLANNYGGVALGQGGGETVIVYALDQFFLPRLDLIKIDVEGMELEMLQGSVKTIASHRPIIYVENDRHGKEAALVEIVLGMNYRLWAHFPPLFNPDNWRGDTENIFGDIVSLNMLCLPTETDDTKREELTTGLREIRTGSDYFALTGRPDPAKETEPAD